MTMYTRGHVHKKSMPLKCSKCPLNVLTLFDADNGLPRSHFRVIFVAADGAVQVMGESRA